jgi:signal transduction histidine kinase
MSDRQYPIHTEIRFSLRFKLIGLITLAVMTTGTLIVVQDFRRSSQSLESELQKRAQLSAANLADAARPLLVAGSSALTELCASFAAKGDVAYVLIAEPSGGILSHVIRDRDQVNDDFAARRAATVAREAAKTHASTIGMLQSPSGSQIYAAAAPVIVQSGSGSDEALFGLGDATNGKAQTTKHGEARLEAVVDVGLSLKTVRQVERDLLMVDLGIVGMVALLGLLVARVIAGLVVRPLNQVSEAAGAVASGNFDVQLPARIRGDEINQLSQFFNHMIKELAQQRLRLTGLTDELTKQRDHERGLRDLAMVINAASSIGELVDGLFKRISIVARIDGGAFYSFEEETQKLIPVGAHSLDLDKLSPLALGEGVAGQSAKQRAMIATDGVSASLSIRVLDEDTPARSVVAFPIVFQERLLAVLELATFRAFSPDHLEFFRALAEQSAVALNNFYTRDAVRLARELAAKKVELENQNFELNRLNGEIQLANQHKSIFLANMSHELRTPLNAIIGFTRLVLKKAGAALPPLQHENLTKVEKSAGHLLTIINDILDIAKVEAGQLSLSSELFALGELIDEILAASTPLVAEKPVKLTKRLPADLPLLDTDRVRLRQILINLVTNAVKFTSAGFVSVEVEYLRVSDRVRITVADTGIGIAEADQERVFDAFRQVDNSTTRKVGGTGLGLTIVKKLAELLGGVVSLHSKVGVGSRFTVELPRRLAPGENQANGSNSATPGGSGAAAGATANASTSQPVDAIAEEPAAAQHTRPSPRLETPRSIPVLDATTDPDTIVVLRNDSTHSTSAALTSIPRLHAVDDSQSVVIIEDNPDDALILSEMFGTLGFVVHVARSGQDGLSLVNQLQPRMVTLDIMMPDLDGWQVLQALKSNPGTRDMPVIIVSIVANEGQVMGRSLGASGFISKPVSFEGLREVMSKRLRQA